MKLKTWIALGTFAFTAWRGYRSVRKEVRMSAKRGLRRAARAI